jgi:hypothetical protein
MHPTDNQRFDAYRAALDLPNELVRIIGEYAVPDLLVFDARLQGQGWWELDGQRFTASTIHIRHMVDNALHDPVPYPPIFTCETVVFLHCDKNFIYYSVSPDRFRGVKTIELQSHPCDKSIFQRFSSVKWLVSRRYLHNVVSESVDITPVDEVPMIHYIHDLALRANLTNP